MKKITLIFILLVNGLFAQNITWKEITSNYNFPQGIKLFEGSRTSPALKVYYLDVDLNNPKIAVRPYVSSTNMTLPDFTAKVGAYAAINGGFFYGTTPLSAVVYPNEVKAINYQTVGRNGKTYPVIRSFFGMKKDRTLSVDWIFQYAATMNDIYTFPAPMSYINNDPDPKPYPFKTDGKQYKDLLTGIGGGPTLVKGDTVDVTYDQEIMWGSGVNGTVSNSRTAVGYTADKHVIMLVADNNQSSSLGVTLSELAQIMKNLGCVEAMNLDGGGSTQMAVPNNYIDSPSENRQLPAIFAVVNSDSLNLPKSLLFNKIIDTGDTSAMSFGGGWFSSANPGFWGNTPAMLHSSGDGSAYYKFNLNLPADAVYNVYAWWVASSNRCTDTPFIINHNGESDTVRADQTRNGSTWKLIGSYQFGKDSTNTVIISDAAKNGSYVVADAIKIDSFDPAVITSVKARKENLTNIKSFELYQNYPNPFNPATNISYTISKESHVSLKIFDTLGRKVKELINEEKPAGRYNINFDASNLTSGVYFYQLSIGEKTETKSMILLK